MFMVLLSKSKFSPIQLILMGIKIICYTHLCYIHHEANQYNPVSAMAEDKWSRKAAGKTG